MKYAIISDVHANPAALERVLADAKLCGADKVVCAGDVVGMAPTWRARGSRYVCTRLENQELRDE